MVTGGAGFIGSHLIERLLDNGHSIICLDNFDSLYPRVIKENNIRQMIGNTSFQLIEGNIRDQPLVENIINKNNIDVVVHLAAKAGIRSSIVDPAGYYDTNVIGTLNLLEAMRSCGCRKMIFASSSSVYGNNQKVPFSEDDGVDKPISPYAATKKAGELLCHTYHYLYGFDIFCLRFFTVYGPRQRPDLAIHKFARLIMDEKPIPFYGEGATERDYTYIDDIIEGIISAINSINGYEIINLGESKTTSLSKMVETLEMAIGRKAVLQKLPLQPGDASITFASIEKAKKLLQYSPSTSLEEGIKKFVAWLGSHK